MMLKIDVESRCKMIYGITPDIGEVNVNKGAVAVIILERNSQRLVQVDLVQRAGQQCAYHFSEGDLRTPTLRPVLNTILKNE